MHSVWVKNVQIGGGAGVSIQSMTNTPTQDYEATMGQITALSRAGCEIVRVSLPTQKAVESFAKLCQNSPIPVVADIHFDYRLALAAIDAGAAKIRINPGNLSNEQQIREVAEACRQKGVPVRIGVNGGSLSKDAQGDTLAMRMVDSALRQAKQLKRYGMDDIVLSVKCSDVAQTYAAYKLLRQKSDLPLHIGLTESGGGDMAYAKSYACLGGLLLEGIGDTIRISLSDDPVCEVKAALQLLRAIGLRKDFVNVISCPTCARTKYDVIATAAAIRDMTASIRAPLTVAVMGCVVNGLGEGANADFGVAAGKDRSIIFARGKQLATVDNDRVLETLSRLILEACNGSI